jgi:hypothetical protein
MMTWNDELNEHLEVLSVQLTHLESLPMMVYEHDYGVQRKYQVPAVQSSQGNARNLADLLHVQN